MANIDYSQFPSYYNTQQKKRALINHVKEGKVTIEDLRTGETDAIYKEWLSQVEQLLKEELKNGWIPPVSSFPTYYNTPETVELLKQHIKEGRVSLDGMTNAGLDKSHTEWFNAVVGIEVTPPPTVPEASVPEKKNKKDKKVKKGKAKNILLAALLILLVASVIAGFVMHSNLTDAIDSLSSDVDSLYIANRQVSGQRDSINRINEQLRHTIDNNENDRIRENRQLHDTLNIFRHRSDSLSRAISTLRTNYNTIYSKFSQIERRQSLIIKNVVYDKSNKNIEIEYYPLSWQTPQVDFYIFTQYPKQGPLHTSYGLHAHGLTTRRINWNGYYNRYPYELSIPIGDILRDNIDSGKFGIIIKERKSNMTTTLWSKNDYEK